MPILPVALRGCAFVLSCSGAVAVVGAADVARSSVPDGGYTQRNWQTENGLPQNTVTAIVQTREGYLWVGTYGGLARFDGARFRVFDSINTPELPDGRIFCLHEDEYGVLWIGHDAGHVSSYRAGTFHRHATDSSVAHDRVVAINHDADHAVWLLRQSGTLECLTDGRVVPPRTVASQTRLPTLVRPVGGDLHVAADGEVARLFEGKLLPVDLGPTTNSGFVMGLAAAREGGLWVVRDWRTQRWDGWEWDADRGSCPWGGGTSVHNMLELRNGGLAVGTMDRGLFVTFPDGRTLHYDRTNGLPQNWVRSLCEDREGNIWLGAGSAGLVQLVPTAFTVINAPDQWQGRTELSVVAARDGTLWVGTEGAGLYRHSAGAWKRFAREDGLENLFVWSLAEAPDGGIWAGTWSGGIFRFDGDRFAQVTEYDPAFGTVFALQFTADDRALWIGSAKGLMRWSPDEARSELCALDGDAKNVCTIVRDRAGVIWYGVWDQGLGRLERGATRRFRKADGLSSDSVQCLLVDDDTLWIGTSNGGLNRMKGGRFASIGVHQGLASNTICHIADDGIGHLWLSTHHGILRLEKTELHACADGAISAVTGQVFDRNEGLPTIEFSGGLHAAGDQSADGRLWFTSSKGVVSVDPATMQPNPLPPPVVLESLRVDGRELDLAGGPPVDLRLPPEHQRIEFAFTALSLAAPDKVFFKYRLAGIDHGWVDAETKRTASYSHLPAGHYEFHVIARNNHGVWNEAGTALAFQVAPFVWQTWWFRVLVVVLAVTTLGGVVRHLTRRRVQFRVADLERRHAIERERARIARDIHDDIGASLTRITMLSQSMPRDARPSTEAAEALHQIDATAREITRALDEIVWAVNPRHDSLESLATYMGRFAQELLGAAGVRCQLDLPVRVPDWALPSDVRHNLFLAFKEALNNVLRHAAAREVCVALELRTEGFVLTVTDDGSGLADPAGRSAANDADRISTGNGLANLQARLAAIGGRCTWARPPGGGTQVIFLVPRSHSAPAAHSPLP